MQAVAAFGYARRCVLHSSAAASPAAAVGTAGALVGGMSDATMTAETPNPDCMTKGELMAFCMDLARPAALRDYAYTRLLAMEHRLKGRIQDAARVEAVLEDMYSMLPRGMRW